MVGVSISDLDRRKSSTTTITITITITELVRWAAGFAFQYYLNLICTVQSAVGLFVHRTVVQE